MSSKTKKRLIIALAGLLASSTAAVLVAYPGTGTSSAEVNDNAGCLASIEGACELTPLAWDATPVVTDFGGDAALAMYSALSDLVGATYGEAQWRYADEFATPEERFSFQDRQLMSGISAQLDGDIGSQGQFQPDSSGASLRHFNSVRMFAGGGGGISRSTSPGSGSQGPGSGSAGGGSPGGSSPGNSAPDGNAPGDGAPGNGAPGDGAPGNGAPGDGAPGDGAPGNGAPGNGAPGDGAPGGSVPGDGSPGGPGKPVSVPEPGTTGLLAFGLALVGFMGRRRRRAPI